jgi:hypothetical protein
MLALASALLYANAACAQTADVAASESQSDDASTIVVTAAKSTRSSTAIPRARSRRSCRACRR